MNLIKIERIEQNFIPELTEEQLNAIEEMARNGFSFDMIADVLMIDQAIANAIFADQSTLAYKTFRKGYLLAELALRQRVFRDANAGSSPAQNQAKKYLEEAAFKTQ